MKPVSLILLMLFLSASPLHAAKLLTIDEAVEMALKNHPQVVEAGENVIGAEARTGLALAGYYPQVTVSADWSKGRSFLTPLESIRETQVYSGTLNVNQTIYDFGRTSGAVEAARGNKVAAGEALAGTKRDLAFRVRTAFYLLLAAESQVAADKETVKAREEVFRQAEEFFRQGIRSKVDVARAEANLYSAKSFLIRSGNNLETAKLELAVAMGVPSLGDRVVREPDAPSSVAPDLDTARREALRNRSELRQAQALKAAAGAGLKTARSGYLPVLSASASVGYADRDFPPNGNVWGVGLNLTIPLFSGFSTVEQVKEATANINAVEARERNLRLQMVKEVESAWRGIKEASARMVSTGKESDAADEARSLAMGRYREGVGSIIEVTDAQSQALDARTARIQAEYDYNIALAALDRAVGKQ